MAASFHLSVCRYRGQKTRYARSILDIIRINPSDSFWDICCGSGAISIAAIESRAVRPEQITMVESGPWGHFWNRIAIGDFDIQRFEQVIADVPDDQRQIPSYMNALFDKPCPDQDMPYCFLILQSISTQGSSFGCSFGESGWTWKRPYTPGKPFFPQDAREGPAPERKYHTACMPQKQTLIARMRRIVRVMKGVRVICTDVAECPLPTPPACIYVDPPYPGTQGYAGCSNVKDNFQRIAQWSRNASRTPGTRVFASGYSPWEGCVTRFWKLAKARGGGAGKSRTKKALKCESLMKIQDGALAPPHTDRARWSQWGFVTRVSL